MSQAEDIVEGSGFDSGTIDIVEDSTDAIIETSEWGGAKVDDLIESILNVGGNRDTLARIGIADIGNEVVDGILALTVAKTSGTALGTNFKRG